VVTDRDGALRIRGPGGFVLAADGLPVAGRHNAFNVAAALAMADVLGVAPAAAAPGLAAWRPLPHRCALVGRAGAVRFVDDSKATNVGACRAALDGLDTGARDLVVILGGQGKGQDFTLLREPLARTARSVVLLGEDAETIGRAVQGSCPVERAVDLDEAVRIAHALAHPSGTVLLAPACASFDQFRSYAHRGECFVAAVDRLLRERTP
jgi:UDP-N-acetylmuramoylalanine--D-glutamate ligase